MIAFKIKLAIRVGGKTEYIITCRVSESAHEASQWAYDMYRDYEIVGLKVIPIKK